MAGSHIIIGRYLNRNPKPSTLRPGRVGLLVGRAGATFHHLQAASSGLSNQNSVFGLRMAYKYVGTVKVCYRL